MIVRASSNAELSLTPRYAEVAVTELCPSKIPISCKTPPNRGIYSEGNDYDEDGNLVTKWKPVEETKPKKKGNWECIVPPCDFIDEDGNLIED